MTGGTGEERSNRIMQMLHKRNVSLHDRISLHPEPAAIGIDSIRSIQSRLTISPIGGTSHAVIIYAAHTMTPEAQNAFLKTLEEPPGKAVIYLETDQPEALLPTVLSRCQTIRLADNTDRARPCQSDTEALDKCIKTIEQLLSASTGERLKQIDMMIKTRDDALAFLDLAIRTLEPQLLMTGRDPVSRSTSLKLPQAQTAKLLRHLLSARTHIQGNITPKLALDAIFLP